MLTLLSPLRGYEGHSGRWAGWEGSPACQSYEDSESIQGMKRCRSFQNCKIVSIRKILCF